MSSQPLIVVRPVTVTDAMLVTTDVPENDYPVYAAGTTYTLAARVIVTAAGVHKVYESVQASNLGNTPQTSPAWWKEVVATNRWKLFDTSNSTQTAKSTSFSYTLRPGQALSNVAAVNVVGCTSIRVRLVDPTYGTVFDTTVSMEAVPTGASWWHWFFGTRRAPSQMVLNDLPSFPNADLIVDFTGGTDLAVGSLIFGAGAAVGLGVRYGAKVGITDYSRKEKNEYGDTVLVQRNFAKRATFEMSLLPEEVDRVQDLLAEVRAVPCLWIGTGIYSSTVVFGFYKDFDILIEYATESTCSLELEGLT